MYIIVINENSHATVLMLNCGSPVEIFNC